MLTIFGKFITSFRNNILLEQCSTFLGGGTSPFPLVATPSVGISQVGISRFSIEHCIIYFASAGPTLLAKGPNWPKVGQP